MLLVHAQGRSRRIGSRELARPSAIGVAHSPCRRLSGSSPSARIDKRSRRTHAGGTRLTGDPQRSRARLPRGARTRDASAPCSRQIRSPSCLPLRCLAGRPLAPPPVGLVLDPSARRSRLPVVARLRRRGLGLTTIPPVQRHGEAGTLSGRGGEKKRIPWDSEMARRWRGDGEGGLGGDRSGQGGTAVARHELRRAETPSWATGQESTRSAAPSNPSPTPTNRPRERRSRRMKAPATPASAGLVATSGTTAEAGPSDSAQR